MLLDSDGAMRKSLCQSGWRHRFGRHEARQKVDNMGALNEYSTDDGSREELSSNSGMQQRARHLEQSRAYIRAVLARQQLSRMECLRAVFRPGVQLQMVQLHWPREIHDIYASPRASHWVSKQSQI